jgi:hypothetical protein
MQVAVFGYTDKRIIIMSLLNMLQASGEVMLITPNRHFKRLTEGLQDTGTYLNVKIITSPYTFEEAMEAEDVRVIDYDHVIYDCYDYVPDGMDKVIYVMSNYICEDEREILYSLEEPLFPIYQFFSSKAQKTMHRPSFFMSKKGHEKLEDADSSFNEEELEEEDTSAKKKKKPGKKSPLEGDAKDLPIPSGMVQFPGHLKANKFNSYIITLEMYHELEKAECEKIAPNFPQKDLATVLVKIFGKDFNMNVEGMSMLLGKGGQVSVRH